eukprot:gnl/TRDRNA2_/TRDRNA2_116076_c1_seq2.p3 gnl/TRDRNA2_/TRDRNA2_116076_c1~~gnl/TRDRNA2_/TRDRNA2_116076_c1_seq2.p3  ORF type:complete len:117 (-),score=18.24 gnl/TRDRNA2_/TRDRNA2_116076_c1_seq2:140-490(-)
MAPSSNTNLPFLDAPSFVRRSNAAVDHVDVRAADHVDCLPTVGDPAIIDLRDPVVDIDDWRVSDPAVDWLPTAGDPAIDTRREALAGVPVVDDWRVSDPASAGDSAFLDMAMCVRG